MKVAEVGEPPPLAGAVAALLSGSHLIVTVPAVELGANPLDEIGTELLI